MRYLIASLIGLLASAATDAQGLPSSVADAYRAYEASVDAEDYEAAASHAYTAWQAAEEADVDATTTTQLAANFGEVALLTGNFSGGAEGFARAAELGADLTLPVEQVGIYELSAARSYRLLERYSDAINAARRAARLFEQIDNSEQRATALYQTYRTAAFAASEAELPGRSGQFAQRALEVLWQLGPISNLEISNLAFLAARRALELREYEDALFYIIVSRSISSDLELDPVFRETSYQLQYNAMSMADPRVFDVVYDRFRESGYEPGPCFYVRLCSESSEPRDPDDAVPLLRTPPVYPSTGLQYENEGYVDVLFDIDAEGRVTNIEVVEASHRIFVQPSIDAVERWRYWPRNESGVDVPRQGIRTRLDFEIADE